MKSIFGIFLCILICGAAGVWHLKRDQEKATLLLLDSQRRLGEAKMAVATRKLLAETLKRNYDVQRLIYDKNHSYVETKAVMQELEDEIALQKKVYQGVINNRRNSARGQVIEYAEMLNGRVLRNAKILNFEDSRITVLNDDGVIKIDAVELPEHLKEFFRLDLIEPGSLQSLTPVTSPVSPDYAGSGFAPQATEPRSGITYTAPVFNPTSANLAYQQSLKSVQESIKSLDKRISQLNQAKNGPLSGFDARLPTNSAAYSYRKKRRDQMLDREIAILMARRRIYDKEREHLKQVSAR